MKIKIFTLVITSLIFPHLALAQSASFKIRAHVPLKCEFNPNNQMQYGLQFKDDAQDNEKFNFFTVNSNAPSVTFSIENVQVSGLTSVDGTKPEVAFENKNGGKIAINTPYTLSYDGSGKYNFGFKITTLNNKDSYKITETEDYIFVSATVSFTCNT